MFVSELIVERDGFSGRACNSVGIAERCCVWSSGMAWCVMGVHGSEGFGHALIFTVLGANLRDPDLMAKVISWNPEKKRDPGYEQGILA